jgi:hypothetical protein
MRSRCFWVGLSLSPEATIVLLQNNLAYGNFFHDVTPVLQAFDLILAMYARYFLLIHY